MADPVAPPDDADEALEGNLGQAGDEEWLEAHRALIEAGDIPENELAYLYDPDRPAEDVSLDELTVDPDPKEPNHG